MKYLRGATSLVAITSLATLTACGGGDEGDQLADGDAEGTLSFATWQFLEPDRGDALLETIELYTEENPDAEIDPVEIARADYEMTMSTQLGAGDGPDILVIPDAFFPELADAGVLAPLDEAIEAADVSGFREEIHEDFEVDGQQLAVGWEVVPYGLFWNESVLEEAGVEAPTDVDSLINAAETITEETGVTGFTVRHQMNEETPWWTDHSNWEYGFGGSWSDGEQLTIDSAENIEAVEAYKEIYDSDGFGRGQDASTYRSAFSEGELGMAIDNSSAVMTLISDEVPSEDIGASALPFPAGGSAFAGFTLGVNANSDNTALALDFIRWMLTEEGQQEFADTLFPSAIATDISPSQELLDEHPWTEPFFEQAEDANSVIIPGFETETPEIRTIILTQIERVLTQDVPAEEALREAQEQAEALG